MIGAKLNINSIMSNLNCVILDLILMDLISNCPFCVSSYGITFNYFLWADFFSSSRKLMLISNESHINDDR